MQGKARNKQCLRSVNRVFDLCMLGKAFISYSGKELLSSLLKDELPFVFFSPTGFASKFVQRAWQYFKAVVVPQEWLAIGTEHASADGEGAVDSVASPTMMQPSKVRGQTQAMICAVVDKSPAS